MVLAQVVPRPVPLARSARRPPVVDAGATAAAESLITDHGQGHVSYRDAQGRSAQADLHGAAVSATDLGLAFLPGSRQDPTQALRAQDPAGGEMVSAVLQSSDSVERATAFYRAQLAATAGRNAVAETATGAAGPVLLSAVTPGSGVNQSVRIEPAAAGVLITLVRSAPPRKLP